MFDLMHEVCAASVTGGSVGLINAKASCIQKVASKVFRGSMISTFLLTGQSMP